MTNETGNNNKDERQGGNAGDKSDKEHEIC